MEINARGHGSQFPGPAAGRGGRGGGMPAEYARMFPGAAGAAGNAQRAVLDQIAKLNAFFDDARKYKTPKPPTYPISARISSSRPCFRYSKGRCPWQ